MSHKVGKVQSSRITTRDESSPLFTNDLIRHESVPEVAVVQHHAALESVLRLSHQQIGDNINLGGKRIVGSGEPVEAQDLCTLAKAQELAGNGGVASTQDLGDVDNVQATIGQSLRWVPDDTSESYVPVRHEDMSDLEGVIERTLSIGSTGTTADLIYDEVGTVFDLNQLLGTKLPRHILIVDLPSPEQGQVTIILPRNNEQQSKGRSITVKLGMREFPSSSPPVVIYCEDGIDGGQAISMKHSYQAFCGFADYGQWWIG